LNDGPELLEDCELAGELQLDEDEAGEWHTATVGSSKTDGSKSVELRGESSRWCTNILCAPTCSRSHPARRSATKTERCWPPVQPKANSTRLQPRLRRSVTTDAICPLSTSKNWSKQLRVVMNSSTASCVPSRAGFCSISGRGSGRKRTSSTRFASGGPVLKANDDTTTSGCPCPFMIVGGRSWTAGHV